MCYTHGVPPNTQAKRDYDNERRRKRRAILIAALDGACTRCGTTSSLEFDHIDPATKLFEITNGILRPWSVLLEELAKCQLLCSPCHLTKTGESWNGHGEGKSGKRNCPCEPCKRRKAEYMKAYMRTYVRHRGP